MTKTKFGVFLPFYALQTRNPTQYYAQLKALVLECERLGFDAVWLDDHLMYGDYPILESWTTLCTLAAQTSYIRLGILVTCNAHRNPALLAKSAATLDILSGGRLEFGIGAGCQQKEHAAYGFSFPNTKERVDMLAEALQVTLSLWTQHVVDFNGKYYKLNNAACEPKPLQKPHPPITVGGSGEKYTLRATAQYADRVDFGFLTTIEEYERKLGILEQHCNVIGRDFAEIERSCWPSGQILLANNETELQKVIVKSKPADTPLEEYRRGTLAATPQLCVTHLQRYVKLGVTYFLLYFADLPGTESLRMFAEKVASEFR
ncbi:MAG: TIGR03560 family F420-dependent LLM class oxidoreductase [Betaproteobacteria bacterium]